MAELLFLEYPCSIEASEEIKDKAYAHFEQLPAYSGLLIDPRDYDVVAAEEDGLFVFPQEVKIYLSHNPVEALRKEKRMELLEYLFELVFELMLNKDENASTSIGFERYLLQKKK